MARQWAGRAALAALLISGTSCDKGGSDLPVEPAYQEPQDVSIRGQVTAGDVAQEGLEIALSGPESGYVVTDQAGSFGFTELKRGTYTVTLRGFDPALLSFQDTQRTVQAPTGGEVRVDFVGTPVPQAPAAPTDLLAAAAGPHAVELSWVDGSDNETRFQVERQAEGAGAWSQVGGTGADTATFADTGLAPVTTYAYRVRACNEAGCSTYTPVASATTEEVLPSAPTGLSAEPAGASAVALSWVDESENESGFQVERRRTAGGSWSRVGEPGEDATAFRDTGVAEGTEYAYRVQACNEAGCSAFSNEAEVTAGGPGGPNLSISHLYITQSTQTPDGALPLVAGKDGLLRVFALSDGANDFRPEVRVDFYVGGSLARTETIPAPGGSVPMEVSEASLAFSWNVAVPASLMQPGLEVRAEVDPRDGFPESDETDNTFPPGGDPAAMDLRVTPPLDVTFVPIRQNLNGLAGNVNAGNVDGFLDVTMEMLPIAGYTARIHAEYATDAPVLESDNANGAWGTILNELYAVQVGEGGSSGHYFGVVKTEYASGVAGMGYLGWPAAIGWDRLPSGSGIAAHEWGHNWNRYHAPGCGVANPDAAFPYPDGKIGVWGLEVATGTLKSPATHFDFMSYCGPDWISDYSYEGILSYREAQGASGVSAWGAAAEPALLVWGRVEGERIILEPAFRVHTVPALPSGEGSFRLEGLDGEGGALFSTAFEPLPVPDAGPGAMHFAFALPLGGFDETRLAGLRVRGGGRAPGLMEARRGPEAMPAAEPRLNLSAAGGSEVEMIWEAGSFPMALVRDAATGEILTFARGGSVRFAAPSSEVDVVFSDGLRSTEPVRRRVGR